ncbi:hypothetical protein BGZ57DRAFT_848029 [Hyaloscypha finlandica]|nr:hypothetical protein BGZ57DRAFT_848029 [Hyaloscypha finlandica]
MAKQPCGLPRNGRDAAAAAKSAVLAVCHGEIERGEGDGICDVMLQYDATDSMPLSLEVGNLPVRASMRGHWPHILSQPYSLGTQLEAKCLRRLKGSHVQHCRLGWLLTGWIRTSKSPTGSGVLQTACLTQLHTPAPPRKPHPMSSDVKSSGVKFVIPELDDEFLGGDLCLGLAAQAISLAHARRRSNSNSYHCTIMIHDTTVRPECNTTPTKLPNPVRERKATHELLFIASNPCVRYLSLRDFVMKDKIISETGVEQRSPGYGHLTEQVMVLMHVLLTQVDPGMDGALSTGAHTASFFHGLWENLCVCLTNWVFEVDKVKSNSRSGHCDSRHQKEPQVQSSISGPQAAKYQDTREKLANGTEFDDFLESSWPHHQYLEMKIERAQVEQ